MDYEKKIREYLNNGNVDELYKSMLLNLFPELAETNFERIRKSLIKFFSGGDTLDITPKEAVAWLEKQGEQKPDNKVEPKLFNVGDWVIAIDDEGNRTIEKIIEFWGDKVRLIDTNGYYTLWPQHELNYYHLWTIEDAKDGDVLHSPTNHLIWIYKDNEHYHACVNMNYVTENVATDGLISIPNDACPATKDEQTILFAKMRETGYEWDAEKKELKKTDDVTCGTGYWHVDNSLATYSVWVGGSEINDYYLTKDEAEKLADKYRKNGYDDVVVEEIKQRPAKWDAKKKELKKIEQKPVIKMKTPEESLGISSDEYKKIVDECIYGDDKSTWSEEDEIVLNNLIYALANDRICNDRDEYVSWLKSIKDRVQPKPKQEWSEEDIRNIEDIDSVLFYDKDLPEDTCVRLRNWLKSLRPQSTWKPSKEQMAELLSEVEGWTKGCQKQIVLESLYNDLMKLWK